MIKMALQLFLIFAYNIIINLKKSLMTNDERIALVKDSTLTESSIKNALIYLLEKDNENDTVNGLRIKNVPLGNTENFVQTSDLWITFTNPAQCKVLSYLGSGNPEDPNNYEYITSFDLATS